MTVQEKAKERFADVEYMPVSKEEHRRELEAAYIAGANEHNAYSGCEMNFTDMRKVKPTEVGQYLVIRNDNGRKWYEIVGFDGRFWVTGLHDLPTAVIEKWMMLRPL